MQKTIFLGMIMLVSAVFLVNVTQETLFHPMHCTWHGTAPICLPSCPMGKNMVTESKCGKNKLACCVTGNHKLCCPKDLNITVAQAEAMAH